MDTKILSTSEYDIALAGKILSQGGLVAFPTETVYGLGANALDENAVKKIYKAKGRPSDNPLIVHIADKSDIFDLVEEVTPKAQALIDAFFPAPLTVILKKSSKICNIVSGGLDTVAVRMPQSKIAREVIRASGCPIAAPSANTSGLPSPTRAKYVIDDMKGKIDAIVDGGDCEFGVESTVITLVAEKPVLLRPGAVTKEMIESVIGEIDIASAVLEEMGEGETAASPGMKYKHYAPKAKVVVVNADKKQYENFVNSKKDAFALCFEDDNVTIPKITFGKEGDDLTQAHQLFDALRELDELGAKKVYARIPSKQGVGMAVYNRLIRSAGFDIIDLTKPFTIGLTGPTGAGKGYVCRYLEALGFKVIDCDYYARQITKDNSPVFPILQKEFGQDIIENGRLNRQLLADRAFASAEKTNSLNKIMFPAIMNLCKEQAGGLCVLDAPQLFEAKADKDCYKIISVIAPKQLRLERIGIRDNISVEQAERRMSIQLDDDYYIEHSDYVVYNDGRDIKAQIDNILEVIL